MANDLDQKIITQLEYYFGDINLPRDKFLKQTISDNEGGWVPLDVLLTFKRLSDLSKDKSVIIDAISKSDAQLIEVSEDKEKLRRSVEKPLPDVTEEERNLALLPRSAYAKGFPKDDTFDNIMVFLKTFGPIDSLNMRHYKDKATNSSKFKGTVNIIFKNEDDCKKFISDESVKYNEAELERKSQEDFVNEKKAEVEARKQKKNAPKPSTPTNNKVNIPFPPKTIVKIKGTEVAEKLNWNDIKTKVKEAYSMEIAHVDFKSGQTEGHLRFLEPNTAVKFMNKLTDDKVTIGELEFEATLLTEEEEKEYYKEWKQGRSRKHQKGGQKRKGNFKRDVPEGKKRQQEQA